MKRSKLTRRRFITLASMVVAGTYLALDSRMLQAMKGSGGMGGGGMGGGGCCGGGTTIIDPPPGAAFYDIPETVKNSSGVYEITARRATVNVNRTKAGLLTYNNSFPGPTIRANRGDTLRVKLTNALPGWALMRRSKPDSGRAAVVLKSGGDFVYILASCGNSGIFLPWTIQRTY